MKRILILSLMAVLTAVPNILADQVTLTGGSGYGPYEVNPGGEFTFQPDAGLSWVLNYYNANPGTQTRDVQGLTDTFQTFCVEKDQYVSAYATYDATISQNALDGNTVALTLGAAWLYQQFASGTLLNYDYTRATTGSTVDLQAALWYYMSVGTYDAGNQYIQLADTTLGGDATALLPSVGAYNVAVLNLWAVGGVGTSPDQDQLVMVPEPSTFTSISLAFGGLLLLRPRRKS